MEDKAQAIIDFCVKVGMPLYDWQQKFIRDWVRMEDAGMQPHIDAPPRQGLCQVVLPEDPQPWEEATWD